MKRGFLNSAKGKQAISTQAPQAPGVRETNGDQPPLHPTESSPASVSAPVASNENDINEKEKETKSKQSEKSPDDYKKDQRIVHHLGPNPDSPEKDIWTANQLVEDAPSDMLDYELHELICTTQPAQLTNATRETNPDGWTECLLTGLMKQTILETPLFPQQLSQPNHSRHRVGEASHKSTTLKPLPGLYATKELDMGDLILSERPVLIMPVMMRVGEIFYQTLSQLTQRERLDVARNQWQKALETLFARLSKEDQEEFWKLRDVQEKDGKKSIDGIVKTNGFAILGLADPGLKDNLGAYTGVCLVLSQLNHSCRPNVERYWDMPSFSMQLRATRRIAEDEELTVSFINQLEPYTVRKKDLSLFNIVCSCQSCKKPKIGDMRRKQFLKGTPTSDDFTYWIKEVSLPRDQLIKRALVQISLLEDDGLENSTYYQECLTTIMLCYVALGDAKMAMRWGKKLGKWELCKFGPGSGDDYERSERYTKHQLWKLRANAENTYRATAHAMKEKMKDDDE
ncbi:hypothetical protein F5050DRAFT_1677536 [Lentinula boryana]|uniref:SET domain-containing protein n=1 Tax=Lentinula boryana TaxID=40481 RepID=A0ABQ8Q5T4_9AGAR|nr:hypothetical protein F5050DRAFT_1677536 [Lentinula boryana]